MTNTDWQEGHIDPCWNLAHRLLSYINEPFNCLEDQKRWEALGFTQSRFTGDLYDMRFAEPDWISVVREALFMKHWCWSVYKMRPGDVLPEHQDTYDRFCKIFKIDDIAQIWRYVIFLEDWNSGHYFEINRTPVIGWSAGDWICWQGATPHLAANLGNTERYTLQVTGLAG